jgi:hypothetical protein
MTGYPSSPSQESQVPMQPICNVLGLACLFVGSAWMIQACAFIAGVSAEAPWLLMGATFAGAGAGFMLLAHTDLV